MNNLPPTPKDYFMQVAWDFIASRASKNTRAAYRRDFKNWIFYCEQDGADPSEPPLETATGFRDQASEVLSPASLARKLAVLGAIYRYAQEQRIPAATWNPFSTRALPRPSAPRFGKTEAVPEEIAEKMLKSARRDDTYTGARDAAVLSLLYATGLRRVSVGAMRFDGIFRREGTLIARTTIKGGEEVEVELPKPYDAIVERWYKCAAETGSPWLFPGRNVRRHISLQMVNKIVNYWAHQVGAEGVHPHQFRVSFVTGLYDAGAQERDIQAAVHHKDPRSTQRYDRGRRGAGASKFLAEHRKTKEK